MDGKGEMPMAAIGAEPVGVAVDEMSGLNRHARRALTKLKRRDTKLTRKIERLQSKVNAGDENNEQ